MTELLFGRDEEIAAWVGALANVKFHPPYSAFGVLSNGELTGAFVFTGHDGHGIDLSLAGRGVVYRGAWCAVLDYVFRQLRCVRLQAHTRKSNAMVRRRLPQLGFKFEGVARRYYGKEDGLTFALTLDDLPKFIERWKLKVV